MGLGVAEVGSPAGIARSDGGTPSIAQAALLN
jgi:hypothetical protein